MEYTHLTFDQLMEIGKILNTLPEKEKEIIFGYVDKLNNRVRSLETQLKNIQYNIESI